MLHFAGGFILGLILRIVLFFVGIEIIFLIICAISDSWKKFKQDTKENFDYISNVMEDRRKKKEEENK